MKICLIQPPIEEYYSTTIRNVPLGLLSIGATLDRHEVTLVDLRNSKPIPIEPPTEFKKLSPFYRPKDASPFGLYKKYFRFGFRDEEIIQTLPRKTKIFCISSMFTSYSNIVKNLIRLIKTNISDSIIICGGSHASGNPEDLINSGSDFVIRGEGESALIKLLDHFENKNSDYSKIPNLTWKKENSLCSNPQIYEQNLDSLPFADYSITGTPKYFINKKQHAMIMISRGCPHRCQFCSIHQTMGYKYRTRSVENVLLEMESKIQLGFRSFDFEDDHFGGNIKTTNRFLDGVIEKFSSYDLSLQAMNGITASNLDKKTILKMKKAGFSALNLALVSPSERTQKDLNRPFGTDKFVKTVNMGVQAGLFVTAYLILGLPGQTTNDALDSILFLAKLPCLIGPSFFYLVPGTETFNKCQYENKIPENPICFRSTYFPVSTENFNREHAMTLFRICRILNFIKKIPATDYQPGNFQIEDNKIYLKKDLSGKESHFYLGLALLKLLFNKKKLYGTNKKQSGFYPIVKENYSNKILCKFLDTDWQVTNPITNQNLSKKHLIEILSDFS